MLPFGIVAEDSMSCGAQPGIRLAGLRDFLRFVQKALTGALHGVLDFLVRALGVSSGELDAEGSPALAADVALEQDGCAVSRGRLGVHHYNRGGRVEIGPLNCWRCAAHGRLRTRHWSQVGSGNQMLIPIFGYVNPMPFRSSILGLRNALRRFLEIRRTALHR